MWRIILGIVLLTSLVGVAYGAYVAFIYDGGTAELFAFAISALIGAIVASTGWFVDKPWLMLVGFLLMVLAPTGFFWIGNFAAIVGAGLSGWSLLRVRQTA